MPELPEVQTVVDTLRQRLGLEAGAQACCRIRRVELRRSDIVHPAGVDLPQRLRRRAIVVIARRAKRIIFTLDDGNRFYIHLGMTGRLTAEPPRAPRRPHTHLVLTLAPSRAPSVNEFTKAPALPPLTLRFEDPRRFGGIFWIGAGAADAGLGPEPLLLRSAQLLRLLARTRRPIKSALLDQALIAGLGNIYADEALFAAGIHPQSPADTLQPAQVAHLGRAIKTTLRRAIRHKGSSLRDYVDGNGQSGSFQSLHRVYARADQPCRTCRTPIQRIVLAGRGTHFCPACQLQIGST